MGRRNHRARRPQARRQSGRPGLPPPPPIEALVIPRGRCFHKSRKGKLRFAEADAARALEQARVKRIRSGSGYMEERYYQCPEADGGCGDYHLTSQTSYEERGQG